VRVVSPTKDLERTYNNLFLKGFKGNSNNSYNKKFIPSSDSLIQLFIYIFREIMQVFKPVEVQGFLDDLIGQRIFIEFLLFIMCTGILILFILFIFNLIFLLNKDKIINKFENKIIKLYFKYQVFVTKLTLIYIPIFIVSGLFTVLHGLH
jgi:hypothetical protein